MSGPFVVRNGAHWLQGENGWGSLGCARRFGTKREAETEAKFFRAVSDHVDVMTEREAEEAETMEKGWELICNECARGRGVKTIGWIWRGTADCAECGVRLPTDERGDVDGQPIRPTEVRRRALPPELLEERWVVVAGVSILWCHQGSQRSVVVSQAKPWGKVKAWAALLAEATPADEAPGYVVSCTVHDEHGNPTEAPGDDAHVWLPSYPEAVAYARKTRASILASTREEAPAAQLSLLPGAQ